LEGTHPGVWSTWIIFSGGSAPLWSAPIPAVVPAVSFNVPIPGVPPIGPLAILTALSTSATTCFDVKVVDTGGPAATAQRLRDLIEREGLIR